MPFSMASGGASIFGITGGVTEAVLRHLAPDKDHTTLENIKYSGVRGKEGFKEATVSFGDRELKIAVVHGLRNASDLLERIKAGTAHYDFVEVMACRRGCILGGGQPVPMGPNTRTARMIGGDYRPLRPRMFPDLLVAHDAMDGEPPMDFASLPPVQTGWFDTKWRYVNTVGGPMIEPGSQKIDDMNDWQKLTWPDLDDYDWEGSAERNHDYINCGLPVEFCIPTGYWERLMSILEVDLAAVALVDEDQKGAVHAFFDKLTDLYEDYLDGCGSTITRS